MVVDVDDPNAWQRWLADQALSEPATTEVITPSGGRHLYFRSRPGAVYPGQVCPGVDIKHKGYVLAPPARAWSQRQGVEGNYEWAPSRRKMIEAPRWLEQLVDVRVNKSPAPIAPSRPATPLAELQELLSHIDPDAGGYHQWVRVLLCLHDVTDGSHDGLNLAITWSSRGAKYREGEIEQKWRSFKPGAGNGVAAIASLAREAGADLAAIGRKHAAAAAARSSPFDLQRWFATLDLSAVDAFDDEDDDRDEPSGLGEGDFEEGSSSSANAEVGMKEPRGPKHEAPAAGEHGVRTTSASPSSDRPWPVPDLTLLEPERELPPVLPVRAILGPEWGAWLERAAEGKGAPVDYVAGALMGVAGSLIGNARWAQPYGDWKEPPIFWVMLVGNPSARKSPALDAVRAPLQALADRLQSDAEPAYRRWLEAREQADVHLLAWRENAKQAAKKGKALPPRPPEADAGEEPHIPKLEVNDATVEGLTKILARQARGTLVVRDELAGWLGGMNRYNTGSSDRPFWIEAFGGRRYAVDRVSKERLVVHRLTVSLVGAIQPEPLTSLLLKPDDDGLVARFCPFWPLLSPPKRPSAGIDPSFAVNAFARLLSLEMGKNGQGEPAPVLVPFSGAAQEQLDKFIIEVSRLEKEAEGEGLLVSFIGKLPGTAVRLALLLSGLPRGARHRRVRSRPSMWRGPSNSQPPT